MYINICYCCTDLSYIASNLTTPSGELAAFYYASASTPTDPAMSPISKNLGEALRNLIVNAQVNVLYSLDCNHLLTMYEYMARILICPYSEN
ncbi:DEHA2B01848p [Debaryomyces hansenii CBS767]|uniref:DEHA2B01848p n=1 Tax=Debaryomyces hansenii (strain ATCC 36239 / CBS 767 / BCRC 21394 / JCM 1990 / NBRC 0083 / IGC 2968) TaxID=284592 RepID=Q6BXM3_DEBHA|nr:DEHA2B01848p [Debaryomyces hansenii CBS767]CAG85032.2 DEHA2B01848p [Debaryomyces hansenii CBS767]|eukprot:XP_457046.2 DEHA2B01848p [Debaryomyces hansenii CBS767]